MKILTNELRQRLLWGVSAEDVVLLLRLSTPYAYATNKAYMTECNTYLVRQGREAVSIAHEQAFLEGLQAHGLVRIAEED